MNDHTPAQTTAISGRAIFARAMALMDELSETTGSAVHAATQDYQARALSILNLLQTECYPASDTYAVARPGQRPVLPPLSSLDDSPGLDGGLCQGVLPYGLAAHLLAEENPALAAFFQQRYEELLARARAALPASVEDIADCYGGVEHGQFGRWQTWRG